MRQEHDFDLPPAGKGLDLTVDKGTGMAWLRARVAEPGAIEDVNNGTLRDFSIGMLDVPIYPDPDAPGGRIGKSDDDRGYVHEVSLVRNGSNLDSHFVIAKRANKSAPIERIHCPGDPLAEALIKQVKKGKRSQSPHGDAAMPKLEAAARQAGVGDHGEKESKSVSKTATAAKAADAMPDGHVSCSSCDGSGRIKGELPCPKCDGKGHFMPKAKKAKAAKAAKGADDDVRSSIDDADDAITDAGRAQAADDATEDGDDKSADKAIALAKDAGPEGSVAINPPDQDGHIRPKKGKKGKTKLKPQDDGGFKVKQKGKGQPGDSSEDVMPKGEKGQPPATDDDGDDDGGKCGPMKGGKKKGKANKSAEPPSRLLEMAHNMLCPAYGNKVVKSTYGDVTPTVIDLGFFQKAVARAARKAGPSEVATANKALQDALGVSHIAPKTFAQMRRAAHKAWLDANPDLPDLRPSLISPDQFRRPFLSAAAPMTSGTTTVPTPDLHPPLAVPDNERTSPNSYGADDGHSVAKGASTKSPGQMTPTQARTFYTRAAASEHTTQMGDLHDWIAVNFPGCCPMAAPQGSMSDADGQMGPPAEMNSPLPPPPSKIPNNDGSRPTTVTDSSRANKSGLEAMVSKAVDKATKGLRKQNRKLRRTVKSLAAAPAPGSTAQRIHAFAPRAADPKVVKKLADAKEAAELVRSRDSRQAEEGLNALRSMGLSPRQVAAMVTADD